MKVLLGGLVVSVVLAMAWGCCAPDRWEGFMGSIGSVERMPFRRPRIGGGETFLAYDATGQKVAYTYSVRGNLVKHIADFPAKKFYVINEAGCKYIALNKTFQKMCTTGLNASLPMVWGLGDASLTIDNWLHFGRRFIVSLATTKEGCVPVGELVFGNLRKVHFVVSMGYFNITAGIKDPSIFTPPSTCIAATENIADSVEGAGASHAVQYLTEKFCGEDDVEKWLQETEYKSFKETDRQSHNRV